MCILNKKFVFFLVFLLLFSACSGKNSQVETPGNVSGEEQNRDQVIVSNQIEARFNDVSLKLSNNSISASEAGKIVSEILKADRTEDFEKFNYEKFNPIYSTFTKSLQDKFGSESKDSLVFLAEALGLNTLEGFEKLSTVEKEKTILMRIEALREKSYLELEFFLANYFLNNKVFESLKTMSNETKDEDLTFCRGYLLKFVKNIYSKNSRYPDAFKKYAIWGEVLSECNLAPIFLPGIGQLKASPEVKAEQLILANVLKSKEAADFSNPKLRFTQATPAIIQSLIQHTLFITRAQENTDQIVFDINSINNSLVFLEKMLSDNVDPETSAQLNLADHLWYNLFLSVRDLIINNKYILENFEKIKNPHVFLKAVNSEVKNQLSGAELKELLNSKLTLNRSAFQDKWQLIKDSVLVRSYISVLSLNAINEENQAQLHALKNRLDKNILSAADLNISEEMSSSIDALYSGLADKLGDLNYIQAGSVVKDEETDLQSKPVLANVLSKITTSKKTLDLNLDNVRSAYFDFTPVTEQVISPAMTRFEHKTPGYGLSFLGNVKSSQRSDFGCAEKQVSDRDCNGPGGCRLPSFCVAWWNKKYSVWTDIPLRPLQPAKIGTAQDGVIVNISNKNNSKKYILVFANGENGFTGVKGTDSPFCQGGIYNYYTAGKNGDVTIAAVAHDNAPTIYSFVPNKRIDLEAGLSGEGGNGGRGGKVYLNGKSSFISLVSLGGLGGFSGGPADCSVNADRSRNVAIAQLTHLLGSKGINGAAGSVVKSEMTNEK